MDTNKHKPIVASLIWDASSQIHAAQADAIRNLGYPHRFFYYDQPIPQGTDIVLVAGPYGTLRPLVHQLQVYPPQERPVLAYWFEESLDIRSPLWLRMSLAKLFSELHRQDWGVDGLLGSKVLNVRGMRLGFLGDIYWLHRHALLDVFALCGTAYAQFFSALGINSILVPRGFHPIYGSLLDLKRDIAVVWLGKTRTKRRKRAVYGLKHELEKYGQKMLIFDGQENAFIFREERTQILNRAWFVVNVFFSAPTDELSLRFYIAAANGCVVLTEPNLNQYPFIPDKHLVECPIEQMPARVMYYLNHPEEWCAISEEMQCIMENELTMEHTVAKIIGEAERVHNQRRSVKPIETL
jgi:hypothetical protein